VEDGRLSVAYNLFGDEKSYTTCIMGKTYPQLRAKSFVGISAANPSFSDVNEIDVESVEFYNRNKNFYQHDEAVRDHDELLVRDETGYLGATKYPWSAKLDTISLGKVAVDIFEQKRLQREHLQEQQKKQLFIVSPEDDMTEAIFKLFEQIKAVNEDMNRHIKFQKNKKKSIENFERIMMSESEYQSLVDQVKEYDGTLVNISQKFSAMTREAKRVIDEAKAKSDRRKSDFGVSDEAVEVREHRKFPERLTRKVNEAYTKF